MALELSKDVNKLYEDFWRGILTAVPANFNAIPAIQSIEKNGYKLLEVLDMSHENRYNPNGLKDFVIDSLIPFGDLGDEYEVKRLSLHDPTSSAYRIADIHLHFEKGKEHYMLDAQLVLDENKLKIVKDDRVLGVDTNLLQYLQQIKTVCKK